MPAAASGQNTIPGQILQAQMMSSGMSRAPWAVAKPRKRKRTSSGAVSRPSKRRSGKRPARLVKGSRAAKAYMASIRRKRKR